MPNIVYVACKERQYFLSRYSLLHLGFDLLRTYSNVCKTGDEVALASVESSQGWTGAGTCDSMVMGSISNSQASHTTTTTSDDKKRAIVAAVSPVFAVASQGLLHGSSSVDRSSRKRCTQSPFAHLNF